MLKNTGTICLTLKNIAALRAVGFTSTEILIVGVCLTLTDDSWCSTVANSDIISRLGLTERSFYYALEKFKNFGVVKSYQRYDYSKLVGFIQKHTDALDSQVTI
jgi:hypothetical protein